MNLPSKTGTTTCLLASLLAAALWLSAQTAPATTPRSLAFSNCQSALAASPNGRWTLTGGFVDGACPPSATHPKKGTRDSFATAHANDYGVVLFVEDAATHNRRPVDFWGYDGEAAWSPTGEAFFVNDHVGSNITDSWLYQAGSLSRVDVREAVRQADRAATRYLSGHSYLRTRNWVDGRTAMVQLCGHTDNLPSMQFDLRYSVTLEGRAKRISMHLRPVTDENFMQECQ